MPRRSAPYRETFLLRRIAPDLRPGVVEALDRLRAIVDIRDRQPALADEGFAPYEPAPALSVHALRAMGRATVVVDGDPDAPSTLSLAVGRAVRLAAIDDRGRSLDPPEVETDTGAPLLARHGDGVREVIFMVPGHYRLRVPGRAAVEKKVEVL